MLKIGLTGGIGSGKSTVAGIFRSLGVPVYEADLEARHLLEHDAHVGQSVTALLGTRAFLSTGEPDRKFIASRVFQTSSELAKLNEIIHPAVRSHFRDWTLQYKSLPYILHEAAILFESGFHEMMDANIVVWAPEEVRHSRVISRDGVSLDEVLLRQKHQWNDARKIAMAGFMINNDGEHSLIRQVIDFDEVFRHLDSKTASAG